VARLLVHSRIAQRVIWPLAEGDTADGDALYALSRSVPWTDWLDDRATIAVSAVGRLPGGDGEGALRHHVFAAQRVKDGVVDALQEALGARPDVDLQDADVLIVARFSGGRCALGLDVSGWPLFQRGWREVSGGAAMKPTLAAWGAAQTGWRPDRPLRDPFCGTGTLLIEQLMAGLGLAPGANRFFGVERWPHHGPVFRQLLESERAKAWDTARGRLAALGDLDVLGSDVDPDALEAARAHLERLGLDRLVRLELRDAAEVPVPEGALVFTNPPWGARLSDDAALDAMFRAVGERWRGVPGVDIWMFDGWSGTRRALGMKQRSATQLRAGPLRISLRHLRGRYRQGEGAEPSAQPPSAAERSATDRGAPGRDRGTRRKTRRRR
jgi:23S rRNA G2445 N2-methylase RlmL